MGVRGDFRKLERLKEAADRVATKALLRVNARAMGQRTHALAVEGAVAGRNPQGRPWRRLKRGGGLALRGAASTLSLRIRALGFEIVTPQRVLKFQQAGASKRGTKWRLPKRKILPTRSLPKTWRARIVADVERQWLETFDTK